MIRLIATAALAACCTQVFAAPKLPPKPANPTPQAKWAYVAEDLRTHKYYVDPATITREAGMTTAWVMTDAPEPEKTRGGIVYLSKVEMRHFNCNTNEHATVHRQLHQGKMMAGKVLSTAQGPLDFVAVSPDTVEFSMLQHVCANREMIAAQ